jgi:hypothetical protein
LLIAGDIDKGIYDRTFKQIREERDFYNRKLEEINISISDAGHTSVKEVFELAISAKILWKAMGRAERVDYLKKVCSNPVLDDVTIEYHLQEPFARLVKMKGNKKYGY